MAFSVTKIDAISLAPKYLTEQIQDEKTLKRKLGQS